MRKLKLFFCMNIKGKIDELIKGSTHKIQKEKLQDESVNQCLAHR